MIINKIVFLLILLPIYIFASQNSQLEKALLENNSSLNDNLLPSKIQGRQFNLGGNSGLIQAANDPLAPIAQVSFKEIYSGSIWKTPNGSANNLQIRTVAPILSNNIIPFETIARLTFNASTYQAGMPVGIGDTQLEYWGLAHADSSSHLALGFASSFPTASNSQNGSGKYSAGPSFVYKYGNKYFSCGFLFDQFNSFAGSPNRQQVRQTQILPFVKFFVPEYELAIGLSNDNNFVYNWNSNRLTFTPLGLDINKIITIGKQKFNIVFDGLYNFSGVAQTAQWQFQTSIALLIPEK